MFSDPDKYGGQFKEYIKQRKVMQWGGLSDQFDGFERTRGITLELLRFLKKSIILCVSQQRLHGSRKMSVIWTLYADRRIGTSNFPSLRWTNRRRISSRKVYHLPKSVLTRWKGLQMLMPEVRRSGSGLSLSEYQHQHTLTLSVKPPTEEQRP